MVLAKENSNTLEDRILGFCFAFFAFLRLGPFFTWSTYRSGIFISLYIAVFLMILFLFVVFNIRKGRRLVVSQIDFKYAIVALVISIILIGICGLKIENLFSGEWITYGIFLLFIVVPDSCKVKSYENYKIIFAITLIPAIVYYFLNIAGINGIVPWGILSSSESIKVNHGSYYIHYPFAVQLITSSSNVLESFRLCGIYDEAGRLGTMAGLFLVAESFKIKDSFYNIIILIAGILSFSVAFYLIVIIYFIISNFIKGKPKNAIVLTIIMVLYFAFMNIQFSNYTLLTLQSRFEITSEGLVGDNRTNSKFQTLYSEYLNDGGFRILFGFGSGAIQSIQQQRNVDGSSYKCYLYNYGIIGFGSTIVWTIFYVLRKLKIRFREIVIEKTLVYIYVVTLLGIFVLNLYQRPTVFHMSYMVIVIGGSMSLSRRG